MIILKELIKQYIVIEVFSNSSALGYGYRIIYWVGSDGKYSVFFNCIGNKFIVSNELLIFKSILYVLEYSFDKGRVKYRQTEGSSWIDAGPISVEATVDSDCNLDIITQRANDNDVTTIDNYIPADGEEDTWADDNSEWGQSYM